MSFIFRPPLSGNPNTKSRPEVLLELDKAEESAFLTFGRCWVAVEKTGTTPDQIKLFEARTTWDRLYRRIQELEGVE